MIISSVKKVLSKCIGGSDNNSHFEEFSSLLTKQNICNKVKEELLKSFDNNYTRMFVQSTTSDKEIAYGIMWFTLFNYCESKCSSNSMLYRRIFITGQPGCGKTTYICSLVIKLKLKKFIFYSDNENNIEILKNNLPNVEIIKYRENVSYTDPEIYECNSVHTLSEFEQKYAKIRIFMCVPINTNYFSLKSFAAEFSEYSKYLNGIIITRLDFFQNIATCLDACDIFNSKILMFSENEIRSGHRGIKPSSTLSSNLLDFVFDKKMHDTETIKMLFGNNANAIDLHTYSVYLKFLMKFESVSTHKIFDMVSNIAKKMNMDQAKIKQIQNVSIKSETFVKLKKHLIILDSMRKSEKRHIWIIDDKRIKRIASGSGTSVKEVKDMLVSFGTYRQAMKYMNYYELLDKIR